MLGLEVIDREAIRAPPAQGGRRRLRQRGRGRGAARCFAELGASVVELDCVPNGNFTRELEPLPEHLGALSRAVRDSGADFGVALDPDADRAAFVDHRGDPLGEEFTVALGSSVVLGAPEGPVVTNLSTSRILDAVADRGRGAALPHAGG